MSIEGGREREISDTSLVSNFECGKIDTMIRLGCMLQARRVISAIHTCKVRFFDMYTHQHKKGKRLSIQGRSYVSTSECISTREK
jgi:hypothetical protein